MGGGGMRGLLGAPPLLAPPLLAPPLLAPPPHQPPPPLTTSARPPSATPTSPSLSSYTSATLSALRCSQLRARGGREQRQGVYVGGWWVRRSVGRAGRASHSPPRQRMALAPPTLPHNTHPPTLTG